MPNTLHEQIEEVLRSHTAHTSYAETVNRILSLTTAWQDAEIARLREELDWYARSEKYVEQQVYRGDKSSGFLDWESPIQADKGERARQALQAKTAIKLLMQVAQNSQASSGLYSAAADQYGYARYDAIEMGEKALAFLGAPLALQATPPVPSDERVNVERRVRKVLESKFGASYEHFDVPTRILEALAGHADGSAS